MTLTGTLVAALAAKLNQQPRLQGLVYTESRDVGGSLTHLALLTFTVVLAQLPAAQLYYAHQLLRSEQNSGI